MTPKARKQPAVVEGETVDRPPLYDPAVHTSPAQVVYVELACACGRVLRQRDPVSFVIPQVQDWHARHAGEGHGPASKAAAAAEQDRRRHAAFVAAGRERDYRPREYPHLDTTDTTVKPWPTFTENTEGMANG